jgi:hypothetical protein
MCVDLKGCVRKHIRVFKLALALAHIVCVTSASVLPPSDSTSEESSSDDDDVEEKIPTGVQTSAAALETATAVEPVVVAVGVADINVEVKVGFDGDGDCDEMDALLAAGWWICCFGFQFNYFG